MAKRKLNIAPNLKLDPDYVGAGTFALLAKKGAGKSYLARVMAEEFWTAKVPFVLMDPMGTSWGLRSSADGKGEGIPVAIFGGTHADAPLERGGGALLADLVVDEGLSMILDMSQLGSRAAEREFALSFFERLYRKNEDLVHVLVDEADLFAPQKPQAGDRQLLGVTENLVRRGRNRGIGITLITQRPAVLNKDVLTQVDGLVPMRITGLTDRQAVDAWVAGHGDDPELAKEVKGTLASLANGECWWWIPELGILKQVQVRRSRTFDSSPSKKRGAKVREPKSFADVDMGSIEKRMSDTIERAKAEDPKELRKQVGQLRRDLATAEKKLEQRPTEPVEVEKVVEVPVLANGQLGDLQQVMDAMQKIVGDWSERMQNAFAPVVEELRRVERGRGAAAKAQGSPRRRSGARQDRSSVSRAARPSPAPVEPVDPDEVKLKAGARRMLSALAQLHPESLTRVQVATLADVSPKSGTFSDYVSALKRAGLAIEDERGLSLTDAGVEQMADELGAGAPSLEELHAMWSRKFKAGGRRMLEALVDAYPDGLTRQELAEASEIARTSGTFSDYLSALKRNTVAEERGGVVYAGAALFIGERV